MIKVLANGWMDRWMDRIGSNMYLKIQSSQSSMAVLPSPEESSSDP